MNPEQALQILEQVRLAMQLTGRDHDALRQAAETLRQVVAELAALRSGQAKAVPVEKTR